MNLDEVLKLPQGILREKELKEIPDIFKETEIEIALAIIKEVDDYDHLFFQADVLERAYQYGWHQSKQNQTSSSFSATTNGNHRDNYPDNDDFFLFSDDCFDFVFGLFILTITAMIYLPIYSSCSNSKIARIIENYIQDDKMIQTWIKPEAIKQSCNPNCR